MDTNETAMADLFRGQFGALGVEVGRREGSVQVALDGELDVASVHPLRDLVTRYVQDDRQDVHVDCTRLTFVDSSGLGLFVQLHQRLRGVRHRLVLSGLSPPCRRVFEVTGLTGVLELE
jgi:anti-sigma B factor antagonist